MGELAVGLACCAVLRAAGLLVVVFEGTLAACLVAKPQLGRCMYVKHQRTQPTGFNDQQPLCCLTRRSRASSSHATTFQQAQQKQSCRVVSAEEQNEALHIALHRDDRKKDRQVRPSCCSPRAASAAACGTAQCGVSLRLRCCRLPAALLLASATASAAAAPARAAAAVLPPALLGPSATAAWPCH